MSGTDPVAVILAPHCDCTSLEIMLAIILSRLLDTQADSVEDTNDLRRLVKTEAAERSKLLTVPTSRRLRADDGTQLFLCTFW